MKGLVGAAEAGQDDEEQVDHIEVELQRGVDVFLRAQLMLATTNEHLGIIHQELEKDRVYA